jgi:hypothetical protein
MEQQHFYVDGRSYPTTDPQLQAALERIYDTPERPRCMCVRGGVEMYIAKHRLFVVKRMPESGNQHDPLCPSYEPELTQSGLGELLNGAVVNRAPDVVELNVAFPLSRFQRGTTLSPERTPPGEVAAQRQRMSLKAVMHFLLERDGMNRWHPAMEGRRNQGVLHKYVSEAAEEIVTKGVKLAERLYVPEPFNDEKKSEIAERRRSKLAVLRSPGGPQINMALVLGEFKTSEAVSSGRRIWIRHMPDAPLLVDAKSWQRIERVYGSVFEARDADTTQKPRVLMCGLIYAKREHTYQVDTASLMLTSNEWIPIEGVHELELVSALIRQRRCFIKPLRYDAKSAAPFPNMLLLDAGAKPVPLHVVSDFMSAKDRATKDRVLKAEGEASWVWHTGQPMPTLPGIVRQTSAAANTRP